MRKIECRGKIKFPEKNNPLEEYEGQWISGVLMNANDYTYILEHIYYVEYGSFNAMSYFTVDPETVGQWTGLTDKNGVKIFEGDIVRFENQKTYRVLGAIWDDIGSINRCVIEFYRPDALNPVCVSYCENATNFEVIGNVFDDADLLKTDLLKTDLLEYELEQNGGN